MLTHAHLLLTIPLPLPPAAPGAFYFVNTLVKFIESPEVNSNMYNTNPLKEVGWVISTMFFVDSIMVRVRWPLPSFPPP